MRDTRFVFTLRGTLCWPRHPRNSWMRRPRVRWNSCGLDVDPFTLPLFDSFSCERDGCALAEVSIRWQQCAGRQDRRPSARWDHVLKAITTLVESVLDARSGKNCALRRGQPNSTDQN